MNTIGILTYWGVPNYGAWTQAYALNNAVRKIVGDKYEVKHLSYLNQIHNDAYFKTNIRLKNAFNYSYDIIPHTKVLNEKELEQEYFDVIITGSDAIWEFSVPAMGNDPYLIGNNLKTDKLISYAASFGVTSINDNLKKWVSEGLNKYNSISVRDNHSQNMVNMLTNNQIKSEIVCDPALLWNFKDDKNIKDCLYDHYIAVYGIDWSEDYIAYAKKFAKKHNCKLISLGWICDWCDISLKQIELRGLEWIGLIKNADYVFTSTFHGLMVGLSFEKEIKFFQTQYVKNRSATLLEYLEINNFVNDASSEHEIATLFERSLDYKVISERLGEIRSKSDAWLTTAIN